MKKKKTLLIVDDEPGIRKILQMAFEKEGYRAVLAENASQALHALDEEPVECVLTDVTMPGASGYDLLRDIKARQPELPVVIMTAYGTIPQAVQAIRDGAFEYVPKPFDLVTLKKVVSESMRSEAQPVKKTAKNSSSHGFTLIGESPAMKEIVATLNQVAESRATVLITGESGVGKEVIAKALHAASARATKPFVAVSCAALPETLLESELFGYEKGAFTGAQNTKVGRFEAAHEGTLFLDEIGEIPLSMQVKLLRVLQEREFERLGASKPTRVDVRLVAATNRNLQDAVDEGIFRLDLLYRLQVVELHIPPLRERLEDLAPLARHFLAKYAAENGREPLEVSDQTQKLLEGYAWPGNVRELENVMERAMVLAAEHQTELTPNLLPSSFQKKAA